jgi:predicted Mrr-cat superfamily restriction endonuclease
LIAIGWPKLGDLTGKSKEEIMNSLADQYGYEGIRLRNTAAVIDTFVNKMSPGDWFVSPNGENIFVGEVTGGYSYDQAKEADGDPHQRAIKWLNKEKPIKRASLPESMRSSLKGWLTVTNLGDYQAVLAALLAGKPLPEQAKPAVVEKAASKTEAFGDEDDELDQITEAELLETAKSVLLEELNSDDPERRLTAAVEVLNYLRGR